MERRALAPLVHRCTAPLALVAALCVSAASLPLVVAAEASARSDDQAARIRRATALVDRFLRELGGDFGKQSAPLAAASAKPRVSREALQALAEKFGRLADSVLPQVQEELATFVFALRKAEAMLRGAARPPADTQPIDPSTSLTRLASALGTASESVQKLAAALSARLESYSALGLVAAELAGEGEPNERLLRTGLMRFLMKRSVDLELRDALEAKAEPDLLGSYVSAFLLMVSMDGAGLSASMKELAGLASDFDGLSPGLQSIASQPSGGAAREPACAALAERAKRLAEQIRAAAWPPGTHGAAQKALGASLEWEAKKDVLAYERRLARMQALVRRFDGLRADKAAAAETQRKLLRKHCEAFQKTAEALKGPARQAISDYGDLSKRARDASVAMGADEFQADARKLSVRYGGATSPGKLELQFHEQRAVEIAEQLHRRGFAPEPEREARSVWLGAFYAYFAQGGKTMWCLLAINVAGGAIFLFALLFVRIKLPRAGATEAALDEAETRLATLHMFTDCFELFYTAAPLFGLFGTVVGIWKAFSDVVARGASSNLAQELAGPMGIALITTMGGIIVALLNYFYHFVISRKIKRNERLMDDLADQRSAPEPETKARSKEGRGK